MTEIKKGDQVGIHYTGTLEDGSVFDSSDGREPLAFEVGSGQIIVGLDEALPGMVVGEKKLVQIPCDLAYGPSNPDMKQTVPREGIPDDIPLEVGLKLHMQTPSGQPLPVTVVDCISSQSLKFRIADFVIDAYSLNNDSVSPRQFLV